MIVKRMDVSFFFGENWVSSLVGSREDRRCRSGGQGEEGMRELR